MAQQAQHVHDALRALRDDIQEYTSRFHDEIGSLEERLATQQAAVAELMANLDAMIQQQQAAAQAAADRAALRRRRDSMFS